MSITQRVRELIREDAYLREALARDIASDSKLARWLQANRGLDEKEASIKTAVGRYRRELASEDVGSVGSLLVEGIVNLKEDIALLTLPRNQRACQRLVDLHTEVDIERGKRFAMVPGKDNISVLIEADHADDAKEILGPKLVDDTVDDLVELTIIPPEDHIPAGGLLWVITSTLHARGIEARKAFSSYPEHYLLVHEDDRVEAHKVLSGLTIPE